MRPRERRGSGEQDLFRSRLDQVINMDHSLAKLARTIDWGFLEEKYWLAADLLASGGQLFDGVASMGQAFEQTFADPKFITIVRCPESIDLNSTTAAEAGTWEGRWEAHVVRGKYLARWQRDPIGWRVAAELYIPLESELRDGAV